jgi:manganese/zinc/iron transport system substrate-binding protein
MKSNYRWLISFAWILLVVGCGTSPPLPHPSSQTFSGDYPIKATVTVGMVADLVRQIGGPHVEVTQLMGAGVDPHLYKTTRDDVAKILNADIVFYNGLFLEGKMAETLTSLGETNRAFAAAEALSPAVLSSDPTQHAHPDPHVWMNVDLWSQVAGAIGKELSEFDPAHASDYAAATTQLQSQLQALHAYGVEVMSCVPAEQRVLVTSHDAFRYFGEAYGIEVRAVQGISTESEAGLSRINELVDLLVDRKVGSIFTESSVPPESIEALLRGAAAKGHTVRIAGTLYTDAMGIAGSYEGTYLGMMDHNLSTIARSLGCPTVPADGFGGKLSDDQ